MDKNAKQLGYKVGDRFIVSTESLFTKGSIVELTYDDDTWCPKFDLLKGKCECKNGKHMEYGAYEDITYMVPYDDIY